MIAFKFNRDESPESIYRELLVFAKDNISNWSTDDYNVFYEATKDDRDMLYKRLEEIFHITWYEKPTTRPKVTLKRGELVGSLFHKVYMLHEFHNRRYIKRALMNAKSEDEELYILEEFYDIKWC